MKHPFQNMKDQFNGNTEKRRPSPHLTGHEVYEVVKNVHVILGKQKRTVKNNEEDDMWKKQLIFWELPYWKDLDVHHSIGVIHVEKNVWESLVGTLLNTNEKTRDHGHVRVDLKKMKIRQELWLDDFIKGTELPISCITLLKNEKEFCGFLKNVKVLSGYSTNVSRLILLPELKIALGVKSHNYHVLLPRMIVVGIQNILPELLLFLQCIFTCSIEM
jgi:hypothetical protein